MFKKANRISSLESVNIYQGNAGGFPTFTKHLPQKIDGSGKWMQTRQVQECLARELVSFLTSAAVCEMPCCLDLVIYIPCYFRLPVVPQRAYPAGVD